MTTGITPLPGSDPDLDFTSSNDDDEVEFLREMCMGKEVVPISDDGEDDSQPNSINPAWISGKAFRLLDLPAELRVHIYQFLLPHNLTISFRSLLLRGNALRWIIFVQPKSEDVSTYPPSFLYQVDGPVFCTHPSVHTQLLLVNKFVSNEASAVLYGSNTYKFGVDGLPHYPISLQSPLIFGPLGTDVHLPLLRNLRSIHINVRLDQHGRWTVIRQRARLDYFVKILKEYADDENKKSLLQELKIELKPPTSNGRVGVLPPTTEIEQYMFSLESLASLRGIKHVEVIGPLDWFAQCLRLCIQGKGGDVQEVEWPLVKIQRRRGLTRQKKDAWVTTRKWYQPMLNWKEFAERNGIPLPEDVDKFWAAND
ncbi:hypothetical protein N0V83_010187 [Neocucurbitaria cava]|uniref:F-box domain-containing protein n=1 Tax=Neocucurbitaria cava TaxID=798079 RepID=A0A9W8Y0D4_9PLEO|nr:hypothetical protein N0V83_010187 [Neocucurbitaria cava]